MWYRVTRNGKVTDQNLGDGHPTDNLKGMEGCSVGYPTLAVLLEREGPLPVQEEA